MSKLSKENNPERPKKISESLKGKESKLKGKSYEEIHGENKAEEIRGDKSKKTRQSFFGYVQERLDQMQLTFLDDEYIGPKETHNFQCQICGRKFESTYNKLKKGKYSCNLCENINSRQAK